MACWGVEETGEAWSVVFMLHFVLVQNQQGKARLAKYYVRYDDAEKKQLPGEV